MGLQDWQEIIEEDFPKAAPVTDETLRAIEEKRHLYRGGCRIFTGRVWKNASFERYRRKILGTPLT